MPEATSKLPDHLRNRCLAPTAVKLHFSAVPKPVRMPKAPESADPDAPKRKRGGQPGNTNRLKHGRYSAFAMPEETTAEPDRPRWLLDEQRIDFGPRRRGAQPGNMNRMLHGCRSVRSRASRDRIKALIARGKALLDICNALAAMWERYVAQREAAKEAAEAIQPAEFGAIHLPPHAGEDESARRYQYQESAVPIPVRIPNRPEIRPRRTRLGHPSRRGPSARLRYGTRHRAAFPAVTRPRDAPYQQGSARTAQNLTLHRRRLAA